MRLLYGCIFALTLGVYGSSFESQSRHMSIILPDRSRFTLISDILSEDRVKDSRRLGFGSLRSHRMHEPLPSPPRPLPDPLRRPEKSQQFGGSLESSMLSLGQDSLDRKMRFPMSISRHDPSPTRVWCMALQAHVISKLTREYVCIHTRLTEDRHPEILDVKTCS